LAQMFRFDVDEDGNLVIGDKKYTIQMPQLVEVTDA
jgi:hypothetical protein